MSEVNTTAYQLKSEPSVIVKAVQFNPHEHPWPDGVISWDGKPRPRDMSCGYIETSSGRFHVMASDYIFDDCFGDRRVLRCDDFEKAYRPVIVLGDYINPIPQGGDATIPVKADKQDRVAELEQLVRQWRNFLRSTALSAGESKTFEIYDADWVELHLRLEVRSRYLLNED